MGNQHEFFPGHAGYIQSEGFEHCGRHLAMHQHINKARLIVHAGSYGRRVVNADANAQAERVNNFFEFPNFDIFSVPRNGATDSFDALVREDRCSEPRN